MKKLLILSLIIGLIRPLQANFEDLGSNAQAIAMGGAMTGLVEDSQNAWINPAGLGFLQRAEISSDYGRFFMGLSDNSNITLSHFTLGIPLKKRKKLDASKSGPADLLNIPLPNIDVSTDPAKANILRAVAQTNQKILLKGRARTATLSRKGGMALLYRKFSLDGAVEETTLGLGWGKKLNKRWNTGLNIKRLSEEYTQDAYTQVDPVFGFGGESSVSALSVDLGFLWNMMPGVHLGLSALDINQPDVGLAASESLDRTLKFGAGYKNDDVKVGLDYTKRANDWTIGSGLEKLIRNDRFSLRSGFNFGSGSLLNINAGFGVYIGQARLDYAFKFPLSNLEETGATHRVSLVFKFGQPVLDEADPGSLEEAYLSIRYRLLDTESKLEEVQGHRDSLEKVLVEETTHRIKERIASERKLAQTRAAMMKSRTRQKTKSASPSIKVITHRVKKGETLQSLAEKYFGARSKWRVIYEDNKKNIGRGGSLKKGQLLVISPPSETGGSSSSSRRRSKFGKGNSVENGANSGQTSRTGPKGRAVHTVEKNETLKTIAAQYYGSEKEWRKIYMRNKDKIIRGKPKPGSELVIP